MRLPHVGLSHGGRSSPVLRARWPADGVFDASLRVVVAIPGSFGILRGLNMANRAIWSMRKRHEWLATPLKKKRVKRATRVRCGLQDAIDRKSTTEESK